jgi:cytochrome b6-f complex iron-sulfur subunit
MADKKKMSVAEMLAAARKTDGQGDDTGAETPAESTPVETTASETAPAAPSGPPKKIAAPGSSDRPSVAEMMAMARGGKSAADKPAAKAAPKKAAPAAKPAAKAEAPSKPAERDTASILAAARKSTKSGPMSKAEAAAKAKSDPKAKAKPKIVVPPMPEKPAYAMAQPPAPTKKEPTDESRREFMSLGFWTVGLVSVLWTLVSVKFMFPNVLREPPSKFKVGLPDAYPAGQVQTKFKAEFKVWIANAEYNGQQEIYALKSVCTHLGCTPNWLEAEQKFKCPCHGSGFYMDGINFEGPAPRPLERYAIRIASDGQIEIDSSRTFQEEMGQWSDPSCFIPV